jgi:hypothetical protein
MSMPTILCSMLSLDPSRLEVRVIDAIARRAGWLGVRSPCVGNAAVLFKTSSLTPGIMSGSDPLVVRFRTSQAPSCARSSA